MKANRCNAVPSSDVDPFSDAYLQDPYPFHHELRESGPVVWLNKLNVWAVVRDDEVRSVLTDWHRFCSSGGVGLSNFRTEKPWRALSLLLETDPPHHERHRTVVTRVLSPTAVRQLRQQFAHEAEALVQSLTGIGTFDAVSMLKAFGDAVGLPTEGRRHMVAWGNMIFNTFGPRNKLYEQSFANANVVFDWVNSACRRENLAPDGLGAKIYAGVDEGIVEESEAPLHVGSFISAGVDTTTNALANLLFCFAQNPDQWRVLRADRSLIKPAIEECLRLESPFQTFFRTATEDYETAGILIKSDQKVLVSVGSANRDPRRWANPDCFDIRLNATGHLGFGTGIHGCVGQMIARLEMEILLTELVKRVDAIKLMGAPSPLRHNTLRGFETLPLALYSE
jgi:cytochrome P450